MKKFMKVALMMAAVLGVSSVFADGDAATSLITSAQTTITTVVTAVLAAGGVILLALLGLKALPFAYAKISAFFHAR